MPLRLFGAPVERVITLAETRQHLRVDHPDDDDLILGLIDAATAYFDGRDGILGRAMATQIWELVLDAFPDDAIQIPLPPLQSVAAVQYYDVGGTLQTLNPSTYYVDNVSQPGWVTTIASADWPETLDGANAVIVRFSAGYGGAASVPASLKAAMKLFIGHLYNNREASVAIPIMELPLAVGALIAPYRIPSF
jgi:uncharacterized phiE125 gp8 family phage protein